MNKTVRLLIVTGVLMLVALYAANSVALHILVKNTGATFDAYVLDGIYVNPFLFLRTYLQFKNLAPMVLETPFMVYTSILLAGLLLSAFFSRLGTKKELTSEGTSKWATYEDLKKSKMIANPYKMEKVSAIVIGTWYSGLVNYETLHKFVTQLKNKAKKWGWKWSDRVFYRVLNIFSILLLVDRKYIIDNLDTHTFLCAPSRSGKGIGPITQTLLTWKDSMIVSDLKRENIRETGPYRKYVMGHNVLEFAPTDTRPTARFNPVNEIRWGTPNEGKDVGNIVTLLVGQPEGKDAHWKSNAIDLIIGTLTHLKYKHAHMNEAKRVRPGDPEYIETNFYHVYEYLTTSEKDSADEWLTVQEKLQRDLEFEHFPCTLFVHNESIDKTMIKRVITLEKAKEVTTFSIEACKTPKRHPVVASKFQSFVSKPDSEGGSVLSTATTALSMFSEKIIVDNTCTSDFLIGDIKGGAVPTDLFLVVPPSDLSRVEKLFGMIFELIITRVTEDEKKAKSQRKCLLLIDEWPAFGKMESLVKQSGFMASYGLKAFLIVQGIDQVKRVYNDKIDFLGNCQIQIFFEARDESTGKYVSEKLGNQTILLEQESSSGFFSKKNVTKIEKKRALLEPAEVISLSNTSVAIVGSKENTFFLKTPKNKFFLNQDMVEKLNLGKALDKFNQVGLRETKEISNVDVFANIRWFSEDETADIRAMLPKISNLEQLQDQKEHYVCVLQAFIRYAYLKNCLENIKAELTPSMPEYKRLTCKTIRTHMKSGLFPLKNDLADMKKIFKDKPFIEAYWADFDFLFNIEEESGAEIQTLLQLVNAE